MNRKRIKQKLAVRILKNIRMKKSKSKGWEKLQRAKAKQFLKR